MISGQVPTFSWGEVNSAKTFLPQSLPGYPILRALASCFVNKVVGEMQMNEGKGTSSEKGKARQTVTGRMYYVLCTTSERLRKQIETILSVLPC